MLVSLIFLLLSYFIYKKYEKDVKEKLTFFRKPYELVEGDWVEYIEVEKVYDEFKKYFDVKDNKLYLKKKYFFEQRGLSKKQIEVLRKYENEIKIVAKVYEGFPFVPSIFISYILILF